STILQLSSTLKKMQFWLARDPSNDNLLLVLHPLIYHYYKVFSQDKCNPFEALDKLYSYPLSLEESLDKLEFLSDSRSVKQILVDEKRKVFKTNKESLVPIETIARRFFPKSLELLYKIIIQKASLKAFKLFLHGQYGLSFPVEEFYRYIYSNEMELIEKAIKQGGLIKTVKLLLFFQDTMCFRELIPILNLLFHSLWEPSTDSITLQLSAPAPFNVIHLPKIYFTEIEQGKNFQLNDEKQRYSKFLLKPLPLLPGYEEAAGKFMRTFLNYGSLETLFVKIDETPYLILHKPSNKLFSFKEKLREKPNILRQLDPENVSAMIIFDMLLTPMNHNLENFLVEEYEDESKTKKYRLISLYNELVFVPTISFSDQKILTHSILFYLDTMNEPISQKIVDEILSPKNKPKRFLINWIEFLEKIENNHDVLFPNLGTSQTTICIPFAKLLIQHLQDRLIFLRTILKENKHKNKRNLTHKEVLKEMKPLVASEIKKKYDSKERREQQPDILQLECYLRDKFLSLSKDPLDAKRSLLETYKIDANLSITYKSNTGGEEDDFVLVEKEYKWDQLKPEHRLKAQKDDILKRITYIKKSFDQPPDFNFDVNEEKLKENVDKFFELPEIIRAKVLVNANFEKTEKDFQIYFIEKLMKTQSRWITLNNFSNNFNSLKNSLQSLTRLTLKGCRGIGVLFVDSLDQYFPNLDRISLQNCSFLEQPAPWSLSYISSSVSSYLSSSTLDTMCLQSLSLKYLNISKCNRLETLSLKCPDLKAVKVRRCNNVKKIEFNESAPLLERFIILRIITESSQIIKISSSEKSFDFLPHETTEELPLLELYYKKFLPEEAIPKPNINDIILKDSNKKPDTVVKSNCNKSNKKGELFLEAWNKAEKDKPELSIGYLKEQSSLHNLRNKFINDEQMSSSVPMLIHFQPHSIDLSNNYIGNKGVIILIDFLKYNRVLAYLNLSNNLISDEGAKALAEYLSKENDKNTSLQRLKLNNNYIHENGGKALLDSYCNNKTLIYLSLRGNPISCKLSRRFSNLIAQKCVEEYFISQDKNFLRKSRLSKHVRSFLKKNSSQSSIEVCNLSYGSLHTTDFFILNRLFTLPAYNYRLLNLNLGGNQIKGNSFSYLRGIIEHQTNLLELNIYESDFQDRRANDLITTFKSLSSLRTLNLAGSYINKDQLNNLIDMLEGHTSITELNLSNNSLKDEDAILLGSLITRHSSLQILDLKWNEISNVGGENLLKALLTNKLFTFLSVSSNRMDKNIEDSIYSKLAKNIVKRAYRSQNLDEIRKLLKLKISTKIQAIIEILLLGKSPAIPLSFSKVNQVGISALS
ncbi:MAG: hypothetical protein IBJ00_05800, partial [Alphaproteobacteria bacterium]|nr:hypothetical protein [Alphaproteobacteria bacterium]